MNSNIIYKEITPTYLYVKEHTITGLRYLGKTTKIDPYTYNGSGTDWVEHINEYGKEHIKTIWVSEIFTDTRIKDFAILASKHWNIVKSKDWANLKLETGLDGGDSGANKRKVADGTHHWLGPEGNLKRVADGSHPFLGMGNAVSERNLKRVDDGTNPFLSSELARNRNLKAVENGTLVFLGKEFNSLSVNRPIWIEIKDLCKQLNIKLKQGSYKRKDEDLEKLRDELLLQIEQNQQQ